MGELQTKKLTADQIKQVKAMGFLLNRGTNRFNGRVITENGLITAEQLQTISEAAKKYGNGTTTFTVRLTLEVPGIEYDSIQDFREYIAKAGLVTGGTGAKVRPVVACKGSTCVFGLCDTQGIAKELHKRFYEGYNDVMLPHKFKIAIGGCPNNCAKPDLNDVGIIGQRLIEFDADSCRACKSCVIEQECPMNAIKLTDGKFTEASSSCNNCGRCFNRCPFGVTARSTDRFKVYIGGRWGKKIRIGDTLTQLLDKQEALEMIEKTILLFKRDGVKGERFAETIERIGLDRVEGILQSDELIKQKDEIINKE